MSKGYLNEKKINDKSEKEKQLQLIKSLIKTKLELKESRECYEYAEGDMIDYYAYKIKAEQARLDYLVKKIKAAGMVLNMINEIKIRNEKEIEAG